MFQLNGIWLSAPSDHVFDVVSKGKQYHAGMINYAQSVCNNKRVAIDIGGCYGLISNQMAEFFDTVYSFEPSPEAYACLVLNAQDNINTYNFGISDQAETNKTLYFTRNDGTNRYEKPSLNNWNRWKRTMKTFSTEVKTLDSLNVKDVDLIKFDVEGHEYLSLQGSLKTIKKYKPVIIMEQKPLRDTTVLCDRKLSEIGYTKDKVFRQKDCIYVHRQSSHRS